MRDRAEEIVGSMGHQSNTKRFPEAYLGAYGGELNHINYQLQTRRYPVNANVQDDMDGYFTVQPGR